MQTFTSHEFNQRASEAQKAAHTAPVLITLQGKPDLVLISHAEYARLTGQKNAVSILEALTPSAELAAKMADIELEIPPRRANVGRPFMADIKKYRGCTQSAPVVFMITGAAMRLPQAKENADNRRRF